MSIKKITKTTSKKQSQNNIQNQLPSDKSNTLYHSSLSKSLAENEMQLKEKLLPATDIVFRHLHLEDKNKTTSSFLLVFTKAFVREDYLNEYIITPLRQDLKSIESDPERIRNMIDSYAITPEERMSIAEVVEDLLQGYSVLILDGYAKAMTIDMKNFEKRSISTPISEEIIIGSHEAFIEELETNIGIIRRRIRDHRLKIALESVGTDIKTKVCIAYIENSVYQNLVPDIYKRLKKIKTKHIVGLQPIRDVLSDRPLSIFPQILLTERPDRLEEELRRGKAALLLDGNPYAIILPATLTDFYRSMDEENHYFYFGSITKAIRLIAILATLILPSLYVAVLSFHYELIPSDLLIMLTEYRAKVPFPPIIEAILLEVTIDLIREASIRLPKNVSQTIGIVGALILGQAAISAGIVSPIMVLVVSITTIAASIIPMYHFTFSIRYLRYGILIMTSILGAFGLAIGLMLITAHLSSLTSMGYVYTAPLYPLRLHDWKNTVLQFPTYFNHSSKKKKRNKKRTRV